MSRIRLLLLVLFLSLTGLPFTSCFSQSAGSGYFDAGAQDLNVTGEQMAKYVLYRFDTGAAGRTLTLPAAADIIKQIGSPTVGQMFIVAVSAEGANIVTVTGGSGVTVKTSGATVPGNSTKNLYFVVTDLTSGSQALTVY